MKFTLALWILLVSFFLPVLCAGIAKAGRKDYDNANPRAWEGALEGYRQRAIAAMHNSFEAFPFFPAAVIVAPLTQAAQALVDLAAAVCMAFLSAHTALSVSISPALADLSWLSAQSVT